MPEIGPMEIAVLAVLALTLFGPKRLPELGRSLWRGIREFKDGISGAVETPTPTEQQVAREEPPA